MQNKCIILVLRDYVICKYVRVCVCRMELAHLPGRGDISQFRPNEQVCVCDRQREKLSLQDPLLPIPASFSVRHFVCQATDL